MDTSYVPFYEEQDVISAVSVFTGPIIKGTVYFIENNGLVIIKVNLSGLTPGLHGFHVHEAGDLTEGCTSMCAHFNPYNKLHGCPGSRERHVGDLGNLEVDQNGNANYSFYDDQIKLRGYKSNIIGRGLIIHELPDDCGNGKGDKRKESLKTGNSGKRIACAVIGYAKKC